MNRPRRLPLSSFPRKLRTRRSPGRALAGAFALAALSAGALGLTGCGVLDREPEPGPMILNVSLHDSLSRYDRVAVILFDPADTSRALDTLWNRALSIPSSEISPFTLDPPRDAFLLKVRGYRSGEQLGVETHILYQAGARKVSHVNLPPMIPFNTLGRLAPTPGALEPAWNPDSMSYRVQLPPGSSSVSLDVLPRYHKAILVIDGMAVPATGTRKSFAVGPAGVTVVIQVTDLGVTRTYQVALLPPRAALFRPGS